MLHRFLHRFADHLAETRDVLQPDLQIDFHSEQYQTILKKRTRYLMQHGFETEQQLADALESTQVYNLNLRDDQVKKIVEDQSVGIVQRLYAMRRMATAGIPVNG